jgi:hypothetical protein
LFERFVQRGGAPGSGLGLVIVKQLVDLMKGSIRLESDPTIRPGTTCTVLLPLEVCTQPEPPFVPSEDTQPIEAPLKILITDDIKMNHSMLKRRFQKAIAPNCIIGEATTGEEALQICEKERFDVILVNQHMEEVCFRRLNYLVLPSVFSSHTRYTFDAVFLVTGRWNNAGHGRCYCLDTHED